MPLGILFWVLFVISIVFGVWSNYDAAQPLWYRRVGAYAVLWILVGILGWATFGAVVQR
jgi:hypothetical protein